MKRGFWMSLKGKRSWPLGWCGFNRFKTVLFLCFGKMHETIIIENNRCSPYFSIASHPYEQLPSWRRCGIADNCGEFIHFHYFSSWNFAWKNRFFTLLMPTLDYYVQHNQNWKELHQYPCLEWAPLLVGLMGSSRCVAAVWFDYFCDVFDVFDASKRTICAELPVEMEQYYSFIGNDRNMWIISACQRG